MKLSLRRQDGFTLVEVTIILLVLVILSTIMLPQLGNYNRLARFVKFKEDLTVLCSSVKKMLDEVQRNALYLNPGNLEQPIGLLVGPGSTPKRGSLDDGIVFGGHWRRQVGNYFAEHYDTGGIGEQRFYVDRLENHLQQNDPGGDDLGTQYPDPINHPELGSMFFGWRGPYFDKISTDPWMNRYAVNSFALYANPRGNALWEDGQRIFTSAVVCYSAGPDSGIDTFFNQTLADDDEDGLWGWMTGGDDIAVVLSAGGPM